MSAGIEAGHGAGTRDPERFPHFSDYNEYSDWARRTYQSYQMSMGDWYRYEHGQMSLAEAGLYLLIGGTIGLAGGLATNKAIGSLDSSSVASKSGYGGYDVASGASGGGLEKLSGLLSGVGGGGAAAAAMFALSYEEEVKYHKASLAQRELAMQDVSGYRKGMLSQREAQFAQRHAWETDPLSLRNSPLMLKQFELEQAQMARPSSYSRYNEWVSGY